MATKQALAYPVLRDPFPHQFQGINLGVTERCLAIFFEPRLGKTLTALIIAAIRWQRGEVYRVIVGCKKVFMDTWEDEARDSLTIPYEIIRVEGKRTRKLDLVNTIRMQEVEKSRLTIVLVNYEITWRLLKELETCGFDMAIWDESRRLANPHSKQSKACHYIADRLDYKLLLTGTPMAEGGIDIYSQYRAMDVSIFGTDYEQFFNRYAKVWQMAIKTPYGVKTVDKVVGIKNREHLTKLIHSRAIARTQEECPWLPRQSPPVTVWVDLSPKVRAVHDLFKDHDAINVDGLTVEKSISMQKLMKQVQATGGFVKQGNVIHQIGTEKLDAMEDIIDQYPSSWKFLIYTQFHHELEAILARMKKMKRTANEVSGRISDKANSTNIKNFQQIARFTDLVVQVEKGALGLDLTASSTMIFYTPSFKYETHYQDTQRVEGIKQKKPTTKYYLKAKKSADEEVYHSLDAKRDVEKFILARNRRI